MKILIIGGTGVISREIVNQLLKQGNEVVLYNRGKKNLVFKDDVTQITGDRQDQEQFETSLKNKKFDAAIDMICYNKDNAESTIRALKDNTEHFIFCSSCAAYQRPYKSVPTCEDAEDLYEDPSFSYAFHKAEMERYLNNESKKNQLNITIIRPSLTFGPGSTNLGVLRQNYGIVERIKQGKPLIMFGDGTTPWSFTFTPDLARGFIGTIKNAKCYSKSYHITSEFRNLWRDLYLEFGKLIGKEVKLVNIPSSLLYKADPKLFAHLYLEKTYSGLFDNSKIKKDIPGFEATIALTEGLKMMLQWYEETGSTIDPDKDALEDKLVRLYYKWEKEIENINAQ